MPAVPGSGHLFLILCTTLFPAVTHAQPKANPTPTPSFLTVTVAPPLTVVSREDGLSVEALTVAELTAEVALGRRWSAGGIVGFGLPLQIRKVPHQALLERRVGVLALGVQGARYLIGDFDRGVKVGSEVVSHFAWTAPGPIEGRGFGIAGGLFIGAKGVVGRGFTGEVDLGVQIERRSATETIGTASDTSVTVSVAPLLNLQIGWTF